MSSRSAGRNVAFVGGGGIVNRRKLPIAADREPPPYKEVLELIPLIAEADGSRRVARSAIQ